MIGNNLRKSGINAIGDFPWGTHLCQFYQTKEDLIDILVPYFKTGLKNNEFCMWVTAKPLEGEDARRSLKKAVKNLDDYIKKGQIEILDADKWYTKKGKFDLDRVLQGWVKREKKALKKGFDGLRISGNTFWLDKRDWRKFADYEKTVSSIIDRHRIVSICSYSLEECGVPEIIDVMGNHQSALIRRHKKWQLIESRESRQMGESLRQERDKMLNLLGSMEDGVHIVNQQNDIEYVNPPLIKEFGSFEGMKCYEYFHDRDGICPWCKNHDVFAGKTVRWEWYSFKNQKTYDLIDTPLRNYDGSISKLEIFRDITDRKRMEEVLCKQTYDLGERVKELKCLYNISKLVEDPDLSFEEVLQGVTDLMPSSWQYPEITSARVIIDKKKFDSANFRTSKWKQTANIKVKDKKVGVVEVYYLKKKPILDEGPFSKEERLLINVISEHIGRITERIRAEQQLETERVALKDMNIALREVLVKVQDEKEEIGKTIQANVDKIVMPILHSLETGVSLEQQKYVSLLKGNLEEITSTFTSTLSKSFMSLTPVEIQVCNMIKNGLSTKEIALLRHISPATVNRHRENIRRKLGMTNKDINMTTYLNNFMPE